MTRLLRFALVALVCAATVPAHADAAVVIRYDNGDPAPVLQRWADEALVPVADGTVVVVRAFCTDDTGAEVDGASCIDLATDRMWLRTWRPGSLRSTFAHENGHRFDWRVMTDRARRAFAKIMGYRCARWVGAFAGRSCSELFADAYSACWRHRVLKSWLTTTYDYDPTPTQHRRVCRVIRRAAVGAYGTPR